LIKSFFTEMTVTDYFPYHIKHDDESKLN